MSVSIVIPTFNNEDHIEECLLSAIRQDYSDFEIIVVDNNSNDNTWNILEEISSKNKKKIKLFQNKKNIGPVLNWYKAISYSKKKFVKILFSDDSLKPTYLKETIPHFNENIGFVITAQKRGYNFEESFIYSDFNNFNGCLSNIKYLKQALFSFAFCVSPSAAVFRRLDLLQNFVFEIESPKLFNFKSHGAGPDLHLFLTIAKKYPYIYVSNKPLVLFRSHPKSTTYFMKKNKLSLITRSYEQTRFNHVVKYQDQRLQSMYLGRLFLIETIKLKNIRSLSIKYIHKNYGNLKKLSLFNVFLGLALTSYHLMIYFFFKEKIK